MNKTFLAFILFFFISGIQNFILASEKTEKKILVAVSLMPQRAFVEAVCSNHVDLIVMVPSGKSPGNYEPTPKEMEQFSNAKVYFTIGVQTEKVNILPKAKELKGMKIIELHTEVAKTYKEREFAPGKRDPHIWLSPLRAKEMVSIISREMSLIVPDKKDIFEKNAQSYMKQLDSLDIEIRDSFKSMTNRKFIVFHPAFGYFADDYNLEMYALEQNGKDATPQHIKEMIDLAKKEHISVVFYQAEISSRQAQSFADEIHGKTVLLSPLSADYINNLKLMAKSIKEYLK